MTDLDGRGRQSLAIIADDGSMRVWDVLQRCDGQKRSPRAQAPARVDLRPLRYGGGEGRSAPLLKGKGGTVITGIQAAVAGDFAASGKDQIWAIAASGKRLYGWTLPVREGAYTLAAEGQLLDVNEKPLQLSPLTYADVSCDDRGREVPGAYLMLAFTPQGVYAFGVPNGNPALRERPSRRSGKCPSARISSPAVAPAATSASSFSTSTKGGRAG